MLGENNSQLNHNESEIPNNEHDRESLTNNEKMGYRLVQTLHNIIHSEDKIVKIKYNEHPNIHIFQTEYIFDLL